MTGLKLSTSWRSRPGCVRESCSAFCSTFSVVAWDKLAWGNLTWNGDMWDGDVWDGDVWDASQLD